MHYHGEEFNDLIFDLFLQTESLRHKIISSTISDSQYGPEKQILNGQFLRSQKNKSPSNSDFDIYAILMIGEWENFH